MVKKYKILLWIFFPVILFVAVTSISKALHQNENKAQPSPGKSESPEYTADGTETPGVLISNRAPR